MHSIPVFARAPHLNINSVVIYTEPKKKHPLCLSVVAVLLKKKTQNVK